MTGRLLPTVIHKRISRPVNNNPVDSFDSSEDGKIDGIDIIWNRHGSRRRWKRNVCKGHQRWDHSTCHNGPVLAACLVPSQEALSCLAHVDNWRNSGVVFGQTSNPNVTRCRISTRGTTVAEVQDLHSPSKNGTSRPLRPPCPSPGSRFEHHLITLLLKGRNHQKNSRHAHQFTRSEVCSRIFLSNQVIRCRPLRTIDLWHLLCRTTTTSQHPVKDKFELAFAVLGRCS